MVLEGRPPKFTALYVLAFRLARQARSNTRVLLFTKRARAFLRRSCFCFVAPILSKPMAMCFLLHRCCLALKYLRCFSCLQCVFGHKLFPNWVAVFCGFLRTFLYLPSVANRGRKLSICTSWSFPRALKMRQKMCPRCSSPLLLPFFSWAVCTRFRGLCCARSICPPTY